MGTPTHTHARARAHSHMYAHTLSVTCTHIPCPLMRRWIEWAQERGAYVAPDEVEPMYLKSWVVLPEAMVSGRVIGEWHGEWHGDR